MRILMVSTFYPWPANAGERIRIDYILRGLAQWAEVTFIAPVQDEIVIPEDLPDSVDVIPVPMALSPLKKLRSLLSLQPYHVHLFSSPEIEKIVREQVQRKQFAFAYCHFIYSLQYVPEELGLLRVLDQHNVDIQVWSRRARLGSLYRRPIYFLNMWKTRFYEVSQLESIWAYVSVSDADRQLTRNYASPHVKHFFVAPNCTKPQSFTPVDLNRSADNKKIALAFMGSYGMDFNSMAARRLCFDLYPQIKASCPKIDFELLIIGKNPSRKLVSANKKDTSITVTGYVDDVRPWLHKADIFVAPLTFGAGTKLKIIEAMSAGLPIVGTDIAFQGLGGIDGTHYIRANSDDQIVEAVSNLVSDPTKRIEIGANGRALAETSFDYQTVAKKLMDEISCKLPNTHSLE